MNWLKRLWNNINSKNSCKRCLSKMSPGYSVPSTRDRLRSSQRAFRACHRTRDLLLFWQAAGESVEARPTGFIRKDMSPKPTYEKLRQLIKKDWWTGPLELKTDDKGSVSFRGFLGEYIVETDAGQASFKLDQAGKAEVTTELSK